MGIIITKTNELQRALFLNMPDVAYFELEKYLGSGFYPENAQSEWTDVAYLDDTYYACFGEDNVMANEATLIYVEIEPTALMKKEVEYFKQYQKHY